MFFISQIMLTGEREEAVLKEVEYQTSRSGGKGGQNVNKVESKVELRFDVAGSLTLTEDEKKKITETITELVDERFIRIVASKHRSQLENKEEANRKLLAKLNQLLKPEKKRYKTKPSKASKLKKASDKKVLSEKKMLRQKIR